ncbi:MAG: tRNA glutamyl-Q(34) synthetase GluQRS [Porticoccaceae bacterium]
MALRYIGRFAPSPSGPLHFGSLLTATASFLDARSQQGNWLIRIEDIDPPREMPGAADTILHQLDKHGLRWDGPVLYQRHRVDAYADALDQLHAAGITYACTCNRHRIQALDGRYDGHCRSARGSPERDTACTGSAVRLLVKKIGPCRFIDLFKGPQLTCPGEQGGDFILRRRDQLWGYQLAVSVDDAFQQITHVIRGGDLLDSTADQIYLLQCLNQPTPYYGHIPVVVDAQGSKLSKQNGARAINPQIAAVNLYNALATLGQEPPRSMLGTTVEELLMWGVMHWQRTKVPPVATVHPHLVEAAGLHSD